MVRGIGISFHHRANHLGAAARGEHIAAMVSHTAHNPDDLPWRFARTEDRLRETLAKTAVMVYLREAQVLERQSPKPIDGGIRGELS
jgi:hypothetical protein